MWQERGSVDAFQEKALPTATATHHAWQRAESVWNKVDELRASVQYLLDYRQSCLICLSETWLNDRDPESAIDLEGFSVVQADRNVKSEKSKGGGVCMFKNKQCNPSQVTIRNKLCTKDIELLAVNLRPCYLPHEVNQLCIFIVYIVPSADTEEAGKTRQVAQAEAKFPDTAMFILGDWENLCSLTEQLPTYHQCVP